MPSKDDLRTLSAEARALVEQIAATQGGPLEPPDFLDVMLRAGSRVEGGTFTRIALHAGLALDELDLRPFRALTELSANAVHWKRKLRKVVLGEQPKLRKLLLGSHGLAAIDLSGCHALLDLELSHNALATLELPEAPLEIVDVTGNPLKALDVSRHHALARLEVINAALTELDLRAHDQLRALRCSGNADLRRPVLPVQAPLTTLAVSYCPLGTLDVRRFSRLEALFCDECALTALDLSANAALKQLSCDGNRLEHLDLSSARGLESVSAKGTPLATLDIRALDRLAGLEVDDAVAVSCTERHKRAIPQLRARFGVKKHVKIADMDLWELDEIARHHNWDDGVKKLQTIVEHPRCDLGTALMVYWLGEPEELAEYAKEADAPKAERAVVKLLRTIEARVARDDFETREVAFEGAESDEERIAKAMRQRVG